MMKYSLALESGAFRNSTSTLIVTSAEKSLTSLNLSLILVAMAGASGGWAEDMRNVERIMKVRRIIRFVMDVMCFG